MESDAVMEAVPVKAPVRGSGVREDPHERARDQLTLQAGLVERSKRERPQRLEVGVAEQADALGADVQQERGEVGFDFGRGARDEAE